MREIKQRIIEAHCYTELVFERINKKLTVNLSKMQIELFIAEILENTTEENFIKRGKNYYVTNRQKNIRITINSNTFRIITVDKIRK